MVKAFSHHAFWSLAAEPTKEGGQRILFYAGDDWQSKAEIAVLIERLSFLPTTWATSRRAVGCSKSRAARWLGPTIVKMELCA